MPTSIPRWPAICAAAALTCAFAPPYTARPRIPRMPLRQANRMANRMATERRRRMSPALACSSDALAHEALEWAQASPPEADRTLEVRQLSRREFLRLSGLAGSGLMLAFTLRSAPAHAEDAAQPGSHFSPNAFLRIGSDDSVVIYSKGPEIGQGIKTAFPMIIAEELDADWTRVQVEQAPIRPEVFGSQGAGGARSIPNNWDQLRRAGAVARQMLLRAAAAHWGVAVEECATRAGTVMHARAGAKQA